MVTNFLYSISHKHGSNEKRKKAVVSTEQTLEALQRPVKAKVGTK
jgi:hypothetical protein